MIEYIVTIILADTVKSITYRNVRYLDDGSLFLKITTRDGATWIPVARIVAVEVVEQQPEQVS